MATVEALRKRLEKSGNKEIHRQLRLSIHQIINEKVAWEVEEGWIEYPTNNARQTVKAIFQLNCVLGLDAMSQQYDALSRDRYEEMQSMRESGGWKADGTFVAAEDIQVSLDRQQLELESSVGEKPSPQQIQEWEKEKLKLIVSLPQHFRDNLEERLDRLESQR